MPPQNKYPIDFFEYDEFEETLQSTWSVGDTPNFIRLMEMIEMDEAYLEEARETRNAERESRENTNSSNGETEPGNEEVQGQVNDNEHNVQNQEETLPNDPAILNAADLLLNNLMVQNNDDDGSISTHSSMPSLLSVETVVPPPQDQPPRLRRGPEVLPVPFNEGPPFIVNFSRSRPINFDLDDNQRNVRQRREGEEREEEEREVHPFFVTCVPLDPSLRHILNGIPYTTLSALMEQDSDTHIQMSVHKVDGQLLRMVSPQRQANGANGVMIYRKNARNQQSNVAYRRLFLLRIYNDREGDRLAWIMETTSTNNMLFNRNIEHRDNGTITIGSYVRMVGLRPVENIMANDLPLLVMTDPFIVLRRPRILQQYPIDYGIEGNRSKACVFNNVQVDVSFATAV